MLIRIIFYRESYTMVSETLLENLKVKLNNVWAILVAIGATAWGVFYIGILLIDMHTKPLVHTVETLQTQLNSHIENFEIVNRNIDVFSVELITIKKDFYLELERLDRKDEKDKVATRRSIEKIYIRVKDQEEEMNDMRKLLNLDPLDIQTRSYPGWDEELKNKSGVNEDALELRFKNNQEHEEYLNTRGRE